MRKITMLVHVRYDSYSYEIPLRVYEDSHEAALMANELNGFHRMRVEAELFDELYDLLNAPRPEWIEPPDEDSDDAYEMMLHDFDSYIEMRKQKSKADINNYGIEDDAHRMDFLLSVTTEEGMREFLDDRFRDEYYSISEIDFIPQQKEK